MDDSYSLKKGIWRGVRLVDQPAVGGAEDPGGRCDDDAVDAGGGGGVEDVDGAADIDAGIVAGVLGPDADQGRCVIGPVTALGRAADRVRVGDVAGKDPDPLMGEGFRLIGRAAERVDGVAALGQSERKALADIAGRAGHQHGHDGAPPKPKRIAGLARTAR